MHNGLICSYRFCHDVMVDVRAHALYKYNVQVGVAYSLSNFKGSSCRTKEL